MKKDTYKLKYHFTQDDFWHEYFNINIVDRKQNAICKYCSKLIETGNKAAIVMYKYGHNLPDNFFDTHFEGCIAIVHLPCINKFVNNEKRY